MQYFPEVPGAESQGARGRGILRYEDVSQEGRVMLTALTHALGTTVWGKAIADHPISRQSRDAGIIPILTRFVLDGSDGRVSVARPLDVEGGYQMAHTVDGAGEVDRLMLNLWVELTGVAGRTYAPPPPDSGTPVRVGRVFAEHVFTRLFAPPEQRKVRRFDYEGLPPVPPARQTWRPPHDLLDLPAGAVPLDELSLDPTPVVFGLAHTDSNQHVNSLVYPRLFEDAALRRFAALGRPAAVLSRWCEIAYRKPCFAGQTMRIALQAFEIDGQPAALGCFVPEGAPTTPEGLRASRPHTFLRMLFSE